MIFDQIREIIDAVGLPVHQDVGEVEISDELALVEVGHLVALPIITSNIPGKRGNPPKWVRWI